MKNEVVPTQSDSSLQEPRATASVSKMFPLGNQKSSLAKIGQDTKGENEVISCFSRSKVPTGWPKCWCIYREKWKHAFSFAFTPSVGEQFNAKQMKLKCNASQKMGHKNTIWVTCRFRQRTSWWLVAVFVLIWIWCENSKPFCFRLMFATGPSLLSQMYSGDKQAKCGRHHRK